MLASLFVVVLFLGSIAWVTVAAPIPQSTQAVARVLVGLVAILYLIQVLADRQLA